MVAAQVYRDLCDKWREFTAPGAPPAAGYCVTMLGQMCREAFLSARRAAVGSASAFVVRMDTSAQAGHPAQRWHEVVDRDGTLFHTQGPY